MENTISIHAPARGATCGVQAQVKRRTDFNPRSREGSDHHNRCRTTPAGRYFNPRSREGSDVVWHLRCLSQLYFNPRSREGSDGIGLVAALNTVDFNPRSREGSDCAQALQNHCQAQFQSTLPRGERPVYHLFVSDISAISIHAPARGATKILSML